MYYAVTFTQGRVSKNTWTDWHMVPSSRPVINPPQPKKTVIQIPGSNGVIDLTETLAGDVTYENRTGSIEFIVMNEKPMAWYELYTEIMDFMHGRRVQIKLEEEPDWYYEGRVEINEWKSESDYSRIVIDYDLEPFKYQTTAVSEQVTATASGITKTYTNYRMPVMPTFTATTSNTSVEFKGNTYNLSQGAQAVAGIIFTEGSNQVKFKGSGKVTITFRGGRL